MAAQEALPQTQALIHQQEVEVPYPDTNLNYDPIEPRIGGESLSQISLSLICRYKGKELPPSNFFFEKACSIFESKRRIILKMEELDPGRGWLLDGARVIKAQNGKDFSLSRLNAILNSLENEGRNSSYFHSLVSKKARS